MVSKKLRRIYIRHYYHGTKDALPMTRDPVNRRMTQTFDHDRMWLGPPIIACVREAKWAVCGAIGLIAKPPHSRPGHHLTSNLAATQVVPQ